jgi:antitoxin MazE
VLFTGGRTVPAYRSVLNEIEAIMRLIYVQMDVYLEIIMHVSKWGNSLAIRLPAAVVEVLALKEGDEIEITVTDSRVFKVSRKASRAELLERLRAFRGRLPLDFKFDRDEANGR